MMTMLTTTTHLRRRLDRYTATTVRLPDRRSSILARRRAARAA
jgi:hypothetical protein